MKKTLSFDDLEKLVAKWHESDSSLSLRQYLGLTEEQYGAFIKGVDLAQDAEKGRVNG